MDAARTNRRPIVEKYYRKQTKIKPVFNRFSVETPITILIELKDDIIGVFLCTRLKTQYISY